MKILFRISFFTIVCIFLSFLQVKGQINSTLGWFEVNYNQGCSPLQVSVKTDVSENDVPIFQFNGIDDPNPVPWRDSFDSLSHTYTTTGDFAIYLTVQTGNVIRQDSLHINVLESQPPVFELKNCQDNGMLVDIMDNFYDSYIIDFGDGNSIVVNSGSPDPVYNYPDSQIYTVQVTGRLQNAPNNCDMVSTQFTPDPVIMPPQISFLEVTAGNDIELTFNLPQNVDYRLEGASGNATNFQFLQFISPGETSLTLTGFAPDIQEFCFRIAANDGCSGNLIYSNTVCTVNPALNITNNVNRLSWTTVEQGLGEESYQIARNAVTDFITFPAGTFNFNDQQVNCTVAYCYKVTIVYSNGAESTAPEICGVAFSTDTPPSISNMSVDVQNNGVQLTWDDLVGIDTSYIIQKSNEGRILRRDTTTTSPAFISVDLKNYPQTCYVHSYKDVCGNISKPGKEVCSILLKGVSNPDGSINLSWTEYKGWQDSIQYYTLNKYTLSGDLLASTQLGLATSYTDQIEGSTDQIVKYIITCTPSNTLFPSVSSNSIEIARRAQLHYPNAFTPNDDGLNDVFKPQYLFIKNYNLNIYNRWGELIFYSNDIETGWDGKINGEKALEGSYTYYTQAEDFQGLKISRSGVLLLLRN